MADYSAPYYDLTYLVRISANDPLSVASAATIDDSFTLTIKYQCARDTVVFGSGDTDATDTTIYIGGSSASKTIDFTQSESGCPLTYGLEYYNSATNTWEDATSENWVSSFSTSTGAAVFLASDNWSHYPSATREVISTYEVKLTVTSDYASTDTRVYEDTFTLSI